MAMWRLSPYGEEFGPGGINRLYSTAAAHFTPALDIVERDDAYEIDVEIPGVDPADVEISIEGRTLYISGQKLSNIEHREANLRIERQYGPFQRWVSLPYEVNESDVEASYTLGVLHIVIPKRSIEKGRKIPIKVAADSGRQTAP